MAKLSKKEGVELIVAELKKSATKGEIMANFGKQWQTPKDTFNKWYLVACQQHKEVKTRADKVVEDIVIGKEVDAKIKAINDANERKAILQEKFVEVSKIKRGEIIVQVKGGKKETLKVTLSEEMKAIELLAKIDDRLSKADGTDKPSKVASTDTEGNTAQNPLEKLIEAGGKIIING